MASSSSFFSTLPRSGSISAMSSISSPKKLDAHRDALLVGGEDLDHVAAHAEGAAVEVDVVALVLDLDELAAAARRGAPRRPTPSSASMP
jgi:hypothetical protein